MVGLGVTGNGADDVFGGDRSSGELEPVARKHGEARELVRWAPGGVVRLVDRVTRSLVAGASSAMSSAAACAGELGGLAVMHESEKGKGEKVAGLTVVS